MNIVSMALAAQAFIQFTNPSTGAKMYAQAKNDDGTLATNDDGTPKYNPDAPVGVEMYGPGSHVYQKAESAIATANIQRGKKGMTGDVIKEGAVELLSLTTKRFVNFDYDGVTGEVSSDQAKAFFSDLRMTAFKEQVQEKQGDTGYFLPKQ